MDNNTVIEEQPQDVAVSSPQQSAEESDKELKIAFHSTMSTIAKNWYGMFRNKPFNIYEITKRTQMKDTEEVFTLLEAMIEAGLTNKHGKGKSATYTINIDLEMQLQALKVRHNIVTLELEAIDNQIKDVQEALGKS